MTGKCLTLSRLPTCRSAGLKPAFCIPGDVNEDDKKKVSVPVEEAVAKKRRTRTNE